MSTCATFGLFCYHTYDSRRSAPGFPDLVIIGPRAVLFRELKSWRMSSRLTGPQAAILGCLTDAGLDADVWRPVDWFSGRVVAELTAVRRRRR